MATDLVKADFVSMQQSGKNKAAKDADIPNWLTAECFEDLLKHDLQDFVAIKHFTVLPGVCNGENFMTNLLRVLIDVELKDATNTQVSYMVKKMHNIELIRDLVRDWKLFDKERYTYTRCIPAYEEMYRKAGRTVRFGPKYLTLAKLDVMADETLAMEDLRMKGFKNVKRQTGLDNAHTLATLDKLAQFHAASACYYEREGAYPLMYMRCFYNEEDISYEFRQQQNKALRDCLILYDDARYLDEKLRLYCEHMPDVTQIEAVLQPDEFHVLNHGDLWVNNIMFQYNAEGAISETLFVDHQMNRYGSPEQDLSYLLLSSTCLENKLKYFDYYIAYYHGKLIENLRLLKYPKTMPTLKQIHISLIRHGHWAYHAVCAVLPVVLLDQKDDRASDKDEEIAEIKRKSFANARIVEHMKQLLPWMNNRGLLEYEPKN